MQVCLRSTQMFVPCHTVYITLFVIWQNITAQNFVFVCGQISRFLCGQMGILMALLLCKPNCEKLYEHFYECRKYYALFVMCIW